MKPSNEDWENWYKQPVTPESLERMRRLFEEPILPEDHELLHMMGISWEKKP